MPNSLMLVFSVDKRGQECCMSKKAQGVGQLTAQGEAKCMVPETPHQVTHTVTVLVFFIKTVLYGKGIV